MQSILDHELARLWSWHEHVGSPPTTAPLDFKGSHLAQLDLMTGSLL